MSYDAISVVEEIMKGIIHDIVNRVVSKYKDVSVDSVNKSDLSVVISYKNVKASIYPYEETAEIDISNYPDAKDVEYIETVADELLSNIRNTLDLLLDMLVDEDQD
jgi:hypothetical protein